ncbi:MAG TPA: hypothetical protein DCK87_06685 [Desulfotomaculum sp.]|nr:hypothetical protein [Desulfotomaculum sp.]
MGKLAKKSTRKKLSVLMATLFALSVLATLVFAVPMAGADEPYAPPGMDEPAFKMPDAEQPSAVEVFLPRKEIPKDVSSEYIDKNKDGLIDERDQISYADEKVTITVKDPGPPVKIVTKTVKASEIDATVVSVGKMVPNYVYQLDGATYKVVYEDSVFPAVGTIPKKAFTCGYWAYEDICTMMALNAVAGYPDKLFRPCKSIVRAEVAGAMTKALQLPKPEDEVELRDVKPSHWAFGSIQQALPYLTMHNDGSFRPNASATREDVAVALVLATGLQNKAADTANVDMIFKDYKSISPDLKNLLAIAVENKLIKGYKIYDYKDGQKVNYDPTKHYYQDSEGKGYNLEIKAQGYITRGEICHLLNNARKIVSLGYKSPPASGEEE